MARYAYLAYDKALAQLISQLIPLHTGSVKVKTVNT